MTNNTQNSATECRELLPCPFCGNGARMLKREIGLKGRANWDWWHSIQCAKCNAAVGYDDNRYRDKGDCAKAWNTRTAPADTMRLVEALRSIAANSCCGSCQEAKLVAQAALSQHTGGKA